MKRLSIAALLLGAMSAPASAANPGTDPAQAASAQTQSASGDPNQVICEKVDTGTGLAPVVLQTANGAAPAETGKVDELRVGNIVARNLRIVTSPGLGNLDVLGMNFLSKLESWRVEGQTLILVPHHPQTTGGEQ